MVVDDDSQGNINTTSRKNGVGKDSFAGVIVGGGEPSEEKESDSVIFGGESRDGLAPLPASSAAGRSSRPLRQQQQHRVFAQLERQHQRARKNQLLTVNDPFAGKKKIVKEEENYLGVFNSDEDDDEEEAGDFVSHRLPHGGNNSSNSQRSLKDPPGSIQQEASVIAADYTPESFLLNVSASYDESEGDGSDGKNRSFVRVPHKNTTSIKASSSSVPGRMMITDTEMEEGRGPNPSSFIQVPNTFNEASRISALSHSGVEEETDGSYIVVANDFHGTASKISALTVPSAYTHQNAGSKTAPPSFIVTESSAKPEHKEMSLILEETVDVNEKAKASNKNRRFPLWPIWILICCLVVLGAVVGGICGAGLCSGGGSNENKAALSSIAGLVGSPTLAPVPSPSVYAKSNTPSPMMGSAGTPASSSNPAASPIQK
jgi:hypothetical protein